MSENMGKAMLYATTYNSEMTKVLTDSFNIKSDSWTQKEFCMPAKNAAFVTVSMKVEGDTARLRLLSVDTQKMWFDTLRVTVDGKDLYASIPKGYRVKGQIDKEKIIPVGRDDFSGLEKELKNKKIIGLGESIHGAKEFNSMAYNFIKQSVSRGECKLILMEMPLYISVRWDLFVQDLLAEDEVDDLKREHAMLSVFDNEEEFSELLQTLREYNRLHKNKVHILGMDTGIVGHPLMVRMIRNSARDLVAAFINSRNKEQMLPLLDFMENDPGWPYKLLEKIIENESFLKAEMGEPYFELTKTLIGQYHILCGSMNLENALYSYKYKVLQRDYYMWLNTQLLVNNFSKEEGVTIIKAHNGHLSKSEIGTPIYDCPKLGYYIDREYGDKYAGIALIAASGQRTGASRDIEEDLQQPMSGSIEKFCSAAKVNLFCYPTKEIPADIRLVRVLGQGKGVSEFTYDNLTKNNDYALFIDKISPSRGKKIKDTKGEIEDNAQFITLDLPIKRNKIFQQKLNDWKSR